MFSLHGKIAFSTSMLLFAKSSAELVSLFSGMIIVKEAFYGTFSIAAAVWK
jgi:hypothetical protein